MVSKVRPVKQLIELYEPGEGKAQVIDRPGQLIDVLWRAPRGELGRRNLAIIMMLFGSGMRINPECLEYILVHELVHLHERHHNDNFKRLMDKFLPHWQKSRGVLKSEPLAHEEWEY